MQHSPFKPAPNTEPARFIVESLKDFAVTVGSIIPRGYEAYVRVFHPAFQVGLETRASLKWSEVARRTGRTAHKLMMWEQIRGEEPDSFDHTTFRPGDTWLEPPEEGNLPQDLARTLNQILRKHTSSPEHCYFAVWEGFGCLPKTIVDAPGFETPGREYRLFTGLVEASEHTLCSASADNAVAVGVFIATDAEQPTKAEVEEALKSLDVSAWPSFQQSANLWWPADRAWCVATEIDFNFTFVAGNRETIDDILASPLLETYEVDVLDGLRDTVNPLPAEGA